MYRVSFISKGLKPVALSTAIADGGYIAAPLTPWNVHGTFMAGALGIRVLECAPYALLRLIPPLTTIALGHIMLRKQTVPTGTDTSSVYGEQIEAKDLPGPRQSA